jgi:two-component system response regulator MprA
LKTILVIDDEKAIRDLVGHALQLQGYAVETVASVQAAEEARQRLGDANIGLVICDIHLTTNPQGYEGYALYQRWTTPAPGLPFLLMSGNVQAQNLPAIQAGTVRFLPKPFRIEELFAAVQALFRP